MSKNLTLLQFNSNLFNEKCTKIIYDLLILMSSDKVINVSLSGGNTPVPILSNLSKKKIDWSKIVFFQVDERFIDKSSSGSNYKSLNNVLFSKVFSKVFPMITDHKSIDNSISNYNKVIDKFVYKSENGIPEFDLIILGVGHDGHTASIFKNQKQENLNIGVYKSIVDKNEYPLRMTMSQSLINNAKNIILIVKGKERSEMIKNILKYPDNFLQLPITKVINNAKNIKIILEK